MNTANKNNSKLVFCHIPKTAGTSFRNALEKAVGSKRMLHDYSISSSKTSPELKEYLEEEFDFYRFNQWYQEQNQFRVVCGHIPAEKYLRSSNISNLITFVRDPVERLISEYNHFKTHHNYDGSFEQFAFQPRSINLQSRFLRGIPLTAIGFLGLTEHYDDSLVQLKQTHDIHIPVLQHNRSQVKSNQTIDKKLMGKILEQNHEDIELYLLAEKIFKSRQQILDKNLPYTYGEYKINKLGKAINGWAFRKDCNMPIELRVISDNREYGSAKTIQFNKIMHSLNSPRDGYVGFKIQLRESLSDKQFNCVTADTEQPLIRV